MQSPGGNSTAGDFHLTAPVPTCSKAEGSKSCFEMFNVLFILDLLYKLTCLTVVNISIQKNLTMLYLLKNYDIKMGVR